MEKPDYKFIAAQLRQPSGKEGIETAERMGSNNEHMIAQCIGFLPLKAHDKVFEIGHGGGTHLPYLFGREQEINYTGGDISDTMVQLAKANNELYVQHGQAEFVQLSLNKGYAAFPFPDHTFDAIFTVNTIYFWDDAPAQAAEIFRVLKPGGSFALCFATKAFMSSLPFTEFGFRLYDLEDATSLLADVGFTVKDTHTGKEMVTSNGGQIVEREFKVMIASK